MTSSQNQDKTSLAELLEGDDVAQYLRDNPKFFVERTDLLAEITLPHDAGGAISLVERQIVVLREQKHELQRQFQELLHIARDNEQLNERMQCLTLSLLEIDDIEESMSMLGTVLAEEFTAETVAIFLTPDPDKLALVEGSRNGIAQDQPGLRSIDIHFTETTDDEVLEEFAHMLTASDPVCNELSNEQKTMLFGENAVEVESVILVPLSFTLSYQPDSEAIGFMAIGSESPDRFIQGMGTMFLKYLGELVSRTLMKHVKQ